MCFFFQAEDGIRVFCLSRGLASGLYTAIVTFILLKLIDMMLGLRVSQDEETEGLDLTQHNERGYDL